MGRKRVVDDKRLLILWSKGMNHTQIADELGVSRSAVTKAIHRLEEENPNLFAESDVEQFKEDEADHLARARMLIMNLIIPSLQNMKMSDMTPEMLRKLGLLADKFLTMERLKRGEATQHVAVGHRHMYDKDQLEDMKKIAKQLSTTVVEQSIAPVKQLEILDQGDEASQE